MHEKYADHALVLSLCLRLLAFSSHLFASFGVLHRLFVKRHVCFEFVGLFRVCLFTFVGLCVSRVRLFVSFCSFVLVCVCLLRLAREVLSYYRSSIHVC